MKILLVANIFEDYSIQLANALQAKGESVYLVLIEQSSDTFDLSYSLDTKIPYYRYRLSKLYSPANFLHLCRLLTKIISFKPDVIHLQGVTVRDSLLFPILKLLRYPLVITVHDPVPHSGENDLSTRFANSMGRVFADTVIVHGELLKTQMMETYHYPGIRIRVTRFGEQQVAPFVRYIDESVHEEPGVMLFFGRIRDYKGLRFLIEAEPFITKQIPGARIIIAGAGNFQKYEDMMVNKDHFEVYNYRIPYQQGAELFQRCSLVVLPYTDASQSGVVQTAYGFKKPVIVTGVGAIPDIVDNNGTGIIVPPKNPEALADAIVRLLRDDSLRHRMGMSGYTKLKTELSWESISKDVIQIYRETIQNKKPARSLF